MLVEVNKRVLELKTKTKESDKTWDSFLPFYLQWYWTTDWENKKSKAWYHGPRIEWMNLLKDKNERTDSN